MITMVIKKKNNSPLQMSLLSWPRITNTSKKLRKKKWKSIYADFLSLFHSNAPYITWNDCESSILNSDFCLKTWKLLNRSGKGRIKCKAKTVFPESFAQCLYGYHNNTNASFTYARYVPLSLYDLLSLALTGFGNHW